MKPELNQRQQHRRTTCQRPYSQGIKMRLEPDGAPPTWVNVTGVLAVLAGVAVVVGIVIGVVG